MSVAAHLEALNEKHVNLESTIQKEWQRPNPDHVRLTALKREKLKIKDEIANLTHHQSSKGRQIAKGGINDAAFVVFRDEYYSP